MKKLIYLIVLALILGLVLTGCLLSDVGQVPATGQSGITYLTKNGSLPGLVGWWRFSGNGFDSSGTTPPNDGTVYGEIYVLSPMGKAFSFGGIGDYVEVAHADSLDMTDAYTIEAWVNVADVPGNIYRPILFRGTKNANDIEVYVQAISKGLVVAHNRENGGTFDFVRFVAPPIGTWFHLAVTFDGTDVQAYYDSVPQTVTQNSIQMVTPLDTDKAWWIGKVDHTAFGTLPGGSSVNLFKGLIDDVRIWNVVLPQEELGKVYDFDGFFRPVDNEGLNVVKAGSAIPVKFNLSGDQGLDIFEMGYPKSITIRCDPLVPVVEDEFPTVAAGESSLSYDADADPDQYIYVWKTDKTWAGACRRLEVKLNDGTSYFADFTFK